VDFQACDCKDATDMSSIFLTEKLFAKPRILQTKKHSVLWDMKRTARRKNEVMTDPESMT